MATKALLIAFAVFLLTGCFTGAGGFLEDLETGAYQRAADAIGKYCDRTDWKAAQLERQNARRQLRLLGDAGPLPPAEPVSGLDDGIAYGMGPVVRVWCRNEAVPNAVWQDLVQ